MRDDVSEFLESREKQFGGRISWRGFTLFYGDSDFNVRNCGGLLMRVGDVFHFEDFEVKKKILGIPVENSGKSDYVKLETSFNADDVVRCFRISKKKAVDYLKTGNESLLRPVGSICGFFSEVVLAVILSDGGVRFFQFGDNEFQSMIERFIDKN